MNVVLSATWQGWTKIATNVLEGHIIPSKTLLSAGSKNRASCQRPNRPSKLTASPMRTFSLGTSTLGPTIKLVKTETFERLQSVQQFCRNNKMTKHFFSVSRRDRSKIQDALRAHHLKGLQKKVLARCVAASSELHPGLKVRETGPKLVSLLLKPILRESIHLQKSLSSKVGSRTTLLFVE